MYYIIVCCVSVVVMDQDRDLQPPYQHSKYQVWETIFLNLIMAQFSIIKEDY